MPADPEVTETTDTKPGGYVGVDSEVDSWAVRERERRQAWLAGPSEREKALMRARLLERESRASDDASFDTGKVDDQVASWADREGLRRKAWAEGPEPLHDRLAMSPEQLRDSLDGVHDDMVRAWTRADYAARGLWRRLYGDVTSFYNELVEEGRSASASAPRRRRIFY
ncbi:hypothetical protein BH10PSE12_BH10PSE12_15590 [soil metagenome]